MTVIHHATIKKAAALGIELRRKQGSPHVEAFWPERGAVVEGTIAKEALAGMVAIQNMIRAGEAAGVVVRFRSEGTKVYVQVNGREISERPGSPIQQEELFNKLTLADFVDGKVTEDEASHEVLEQANTDMVGELHEKLDEPTPFEQGAADYKAGVVAADCPFDEGSDEAEEWYQGWDEAADASEGDGEEEARSATVVADTYRAKYREAGHPDHCGDWLSYTLLNITTNSAGINIELLDELAKMNGVDNSKYDRSNRGWQGRLRMTTRNLMARAIWLNDGQFIVTPGLSVDGSGIIKAPAEWMAAQRFKRPKAKAAPAAETQEQGA